MTEDVRFIGLNSNRQDSLAELKQFVADQQIEFPCGKDFDNVIADQLHVLRTPEVIVVDQDRTIQYRGRIDDQYLPGVSRSKPERQDLQVALTELLDRQTGDGASHQTRRLPTGPSHSARC